MVANGLCKRRVVAPVLIPATLVSGETVNHYLPPNEGRSGTWRGLCVCSYII